MAASIRGSGAVWRVAVLAGGWLWPVAAALAQPSPDGGDAAAQEAQRRQQRERALRERQEAAPDVRLGPSPGAAAAQRLPADETPCVPVDRIELVGDGAERFRWALKAADGGDDPFVGRCVGSAGINLLMKRVQNALVARGYVTTRVLAAPQRPAGGTLFLTIVPGRVRTVRAGDGSGRRATRWNALPAASGDLLNLRDVEQGLENFRRLPTVDAGIRIAAADGPDARPGDSDLIVDWMQRRPLRLNLSVDDSGSRYTGRYQGAATISLDNGLLLNDLFYLSLNHDLGNRYTDGKGTRGLTAHYEIPYGYWLLGATAGSYDYRQQVAGANQTYVYGGTGRTAEIRLARTVYRDAVRKTGLYLRGWLRASNNFIDDTEIEVQRRRTAGWEAGLTQREFIGAATFDVNLGYRRGTGAARALRAPEEDFGEGTARPSLAVAEIRLDAPLKAVRPPSAWRLDYSMVWRAQWSRTPLVPQDRFAIGGRYTVRGFDGETALLGERGWMLRNEIGLTPGHAGQQLYLGVDYGEVGGPSARLLPGRHLAGTVVGWRGSYRNAYWDVFVGRLISKPDGFRTANVTAGFNCGASF